jgi:hypothetical protein
MGPLCPVVASHPSCAVVPDSVRAVPQLFFSPSPSRLPPGEGKVCIPAALPIPSHTPMALTLSVVPQSAIPPCVPSQSRTQTQAGPADTCRKQHPTFFGLSRLQAYLKSDACSLTVKLSSSAAPRSGAHHVCTCRQPNRSHSSGPTTRRGVARTRSRDRERLVGPD